MASSLPMAPSCDSNAPWVTSPKHSIKRIWIACEARARSDTCAIRRPAKFRFSKRNRFCVTCQHGQIAVCHNGNLPFAREERQRLEREGAIFSSTSDTEVVLHGVARSRSPVREAIPEVLRETEGAFSMLFLTPSRVDCDSRSVAAFVRWRWDGSAMRGLSLLKRVLLI